MGTHLKMEYTRSVTTNAAGDEIFRIVSECTDPGEINNGTGLEDKGVFIYSIFNSRNPAADIFQRVCTVNDLETYQNDRDEAIANNDTYWRSYTLTRDYTELSTAVKAITVIGDRVNALVNDYTTYFDEFKVVPADPDGTKTYPTADADYVTALKATYETKVDDFTDALLLQTTADTALSTANDTLVASRDSLKEWQETRDLVCGGNLSEEGNRYGLKTYITEVANAFSNLYDGSGTSPYVTNADAVKDALTTFVNSAEYVKMGDGSVYTQRIAVTPGQSPVLSDIGRIVLPDGGTSTASGILVAYDYNNNYWWVVNVTQTGVWELGDTIKIDFGSARGTITAVVDSPEGPLNGLADVITLRYGLESTLNAIIAAGIPTIAHNAIDDLDDGAIAVCEHVTDITADKSLAVTTAETDLYTKEAAYIAAQAATQAAYDEVITAYDNVKDVCPDWSPVPPLPAQP